LYREDVLITYRSSGESEQSNKHPVARVPATKQHRKRKQQSNKQEASQFFNSRQNTAP
jgi:hypothetical protein